jgi:hypothetical protein
MIKYGIELGDWKTAEQGAEEMVAAAKDDRASARAHKLRRCDTPTPIYSPLRCVSLRSPVTNMYHARHANKNAAIVWTPSMEGG